MTVAVYSRAEALRRELAEARQAISEATNLARYDAAKARVAYLQKLLERYDPSAKPDPWRW